MSPKEKAIELMDKFESILAYKIYPFYKCNKSAIKVDYLDQTRQSALTAVDEIINTIGNMEDDSIWIVDRWGSNQQYWLAVKKEIEQL